MPDLLKTPLYELHLQMGGKIVDFAGYALPVQFEGMGVMKEHLHTRAAAGLFDVSHMGPALLTGDVNAFEKIVPADIANLAAGQSCYSVLLNEQGGIVDDLIVTRIDARTLYIVVNAARKLDVFEYISDNAGGCSLLPQKDRTLLALQGPGAEDALATYYPDIRKLRFMQTENIMGALISRSGYTGEDGFEIALPERTGRHLARNLLQNPEVKMIGLGARDSLRLEAGLCLYGHDLDETTTPIEASLAWVIPKHRREAGSFAGAAHILQQLAEGAPRKRVGIRPDGRAPVREGVELFAGGKKIGSVTSGGFSPTLDAPVAMGYVDPAFARSGTEIFARVRGQDLPCRVAPLPFVKHKYKKD